MTCSSADDSRTVGQVKESVSPIWLVVAADEAFAMPMAVTLFSALSHLPAEKTVRVVVFDVGVRSESRARASQVVEGTEPTVHLEWVCPESEMIEDMDLDIQPRFNASIFYRLLIPEVLPDTCSRAFYLDSDLVVEQSLLPLWNTALGDDALLAAPERTVSCPRIGVAEWERLGLEADQLYFNAGFMLINLEFWREQRVSQQALRYLLDPEIEIRYSGVQEPLNAVLASQWRAVDPQWNVIHTFYDREKRTASEEMMDIDLRPAVRNPSVIHYTGSDKPWAPFCGHPSRDRFYHYLWRSGWFTTREYLQWRGRMARRRWLDWMKNVSRPYRHVLGLRRSLFET